MERKLTLKQFILLPVLLILAFVAQAQNYNNIEFIENKGQWDSRVKFKGDVTGGAFFIRSGGFTVLQHNQQDLEQFRTSGHSHSTDMAKNAKEDLVLRSHAFNVDFVGSNPDMEIMPDKALPTYNNYFIGNDPSKWAGSCRIYQAVTLKNVYANVDVRYYTDKGTLKYDIIVKPGGDISKIALKYEGAESQLKNKELVVSTSVGDMRESNPYTYQADAKGKEILTASIL